MVNYLNATLDVLHAMNMVILADIIAYHVKILVYIFWSNMMKISQKVIAKEAILNVEFYHIIMIIILLKN